MGKIDKELILRYLSGATSALEDEHVNSWIVESGENRRLMEDCYFIWQASKSLNVMQSVNTQKTLSSLKAKIRQKEKQTRLKHYLLWMQRVAATLLVPALLLSYFLYNLHRNEAVQYVEVKANPGVITSVILPDSTKVWINACSTLKYPTHFTDDVREVVLEGEGYFEVTKKDEALFSVKTGKNYEVRVLGTAFNVKAYPEEDKIETTLVEGIVSLNIKAAVQKQILYQLKPNQKATFEGGNLVVQWVDPVYETGWKEGKMYFKNYPMKEVIRRLSRHYNVTFDVKNPKVLESSITAKFESEQLLQVMEYIKLASGIKYIVHDVNIKEDRLSRMVIELTK